MSKNGITSAAWRALLFVGGRLHREPTGALPAASYGDPARHVQFEREREISHQIRKELAQLNKFDGSKQEATMSMMGEFLEAGDQCAPEKETPFSVVMEIWKRWMHLQDFQHTSGDANQQDTKDFMRTGEAVDVMINSLPRHELWAIRKSQAIASVWIFKDHSYLDALGSAERILVPKMKINVATRRYFN